MWFKMGKQTAQAKEVYSLKGSKFVTGVKIKAKVNSNVIDSPAKSIVYNRTSNCILINMAVNWMKKIRR